MDMKYPDIYFTPQYGEIYEKIENGNLEIYKFKREYGEIYYQFIKREIPIKLDNEVYFDIITPYGYGGPIVINSNKERKQELINEFTEEFKEYCYSNNIISEFIRFHPIVKNYQDFKENYKVEFDRNTLATNLKDYDDPINSEFSKSCKKKIRQGLNKGLKAEFDFDCSTIDKFLEIYYSTMDRNNAREYYYFDKEYFYNMIDKLRDNVFIINIKLEDKIVAAGFYMKYNNLMHAHLSGTLPEYLNISPANIIRYSATIWGKENGIDYFHHGGGTSNSKEDGLYKFKKGFSQNSEFDFYVCKNIINSDIYTKMVDEVKKYKEVNENFFPLYRG